MNFNKKRRGIILFLFSLPILPALTKLEFIQKIYLDRTVNKGGWLLNESDK